MVGGAGRPAATAPRHYHVVDLDDQTGLVRHHNHHLNLYPAQPNMAVPPPPDTPPSQAPLYSLILNATSMAATVLPPAANHTAVGAASNVTDTDLDLYHGSESDCKVFLFIVYVVVNGGMCVFGLIGNTLSFMVLQWEKHNYVATFLLQVMSLVDNLFLLATGYSQIFSAILIYQETNNIMMPYNMAYIFPLVHITQLGTIWITVLIAFNRYIAICKPFQAPMLCTITRVRLQVLAMTLFIILYNIPRFLEYEVQYVMDPATNETVPAGMETELKKDRRYNIIYESVLYCLCVFLGPLIILIVLNTCLIQELMRARRRLQDRQLPASMTGEDQENNLTLVMIVIVLIFLVCQTPAFLNQLLYILIGNQYACGRAYFYFYHISNLIVTANSSLNFVVYCIFRKQFRERLYAFCRRDRHSYIMTDAYTCNGRTASVYSRGTNPVHL